ncbi:MAG: alpha/beta fold hydrolase [Alphaproteobacteria bacterium]|nr:alpha/beta fold hydrolase [Alphaproteobacteria bacterium]
MTSETIAGMVVEVDGTGGTVIMVHGLGGTSNTFTPQMSVFDGRSRVVRPDLPGSGRSALDGDLSIPDLAGAILGLADALGADRVHLVGHSLGTIVCQHAAVRHPGAVASLVLLGALTAPPDAARAALRERAAKARAEGMAEIAEAVARAATSEATRRDLPVAFAAVRECLMRQPPKGYAATCEALAAADAADAGAIDCPTLLITGEDDVVAPPDVARGLGDRITGARLAILPRCGHWPSLERASEVNREMRSFYRALG